MSVVAHTVPAMLPHPWRRLRALAHIDLRWHDADDPMGVTDFKTYISLSRSLTWAERRVTVLHECLHVERGPVLPALEAKEERRIDREAARWLLPDVFAIGEALAWAHTLEEAADELGVDEPLLRVRLRYLHPSERAYLHRRLDDLA